MKNHSLPKTPATITIDQVIRTRRKTIAIIIQPDGRLVVRAPLRATNEAIRHLVEKKANWILSHQERLKTAVQFAPKKYAPGEEFWYLGQLYPLEIVPKSRLPLTLEGHFRLAQTALPKAQTVFEHWYKKQAAEVLPARLREYAGRTGLHYAQVKITSARTRWGSCSPNGNICFSWRLVLAPLPVIDYVIVHELVHLQIKNHSKEFWNRVMQIMPDYQQRRKWLKTNAHSL